VVDFLWVVHCNHAPILHRYGDMKPQMLDGRMHARMDWYSDDFILCPMLLHCIGQTTRCNDKHLNKDNQKTNILVRLQDWIKTTPTDSVSVHLW